MVRGTGSSRVFIMLRGSWLLVMTYTVTIIKLSSPSRRGRNCSRRSFIRPAFFLHRWSRVSGSYSHIRGKLRYAHLGKGVR